MCLEDSSFFFIWDLFFIMNEPDMFISSWGFLYVFIIWNVLAYLKYLVKLRKICKLHPVNLYMDWKSSPTASKFALVIFISLFIRLNLVIDVSWYSSIIMYFQLGNLVLLLRMEVHLFIISLKSMELFSFNVFMYIRCMFNVSKIICLFM